MKRSPIQPKTGPCLDCGRETRLIAKRCNFCYWKSRNSVKPKKPRFAPHVPISPVSTKQKQRLAKYALVRAEYLANKKVCEALISGVCSGTATEIHHPKGKLGDLLTDTGNMVAICRNCHEWAHSNDAEARERGLLLSRLKVEA